MQNRRVLACLDNPLKYATHKLPLGFWMSGAMPRQQRLPKPPHTGGFIPEWRAGSGRNVACDQGGDIISGIGRRLALESAGARLCGERATQGGMILSIR